MDHFRDFSELQPKNIPRTSRYFGTQLQTINTPFSEFVSEIANKLFENVPEKETYVNHILSELQQLFNKFKKGDVEDRADILGFITVTPEMKQALETHSNNLNSITNDLLGKYNKPELQAKWTKLLARIGSLQFKLMVKNLRAIKKLHQSDAVFKDAQRMQTILSEQSDKMQAMELAHANALRDANMAHEQKIQEIDAEKQAAAPVERARLEQEKTALVAAHTAEQERLSNQYAEQKSALDAQLLQTQAAHATAMTGLEARTKEETTDFIMKMIDALNTQAGILESLYDKNIDETNNDYHTLKGVLRAPSVPHDDGKEQPAAASASAFSPTIDPRASSVPFGELPAKNEGDDHKDEPHIDKEHYAYKKGDKRIIEYTSADNLTKNQTTEGYYKINGKWWPKQINVDSTKVQEFEKIEGVNDFYIKVEKTYTAGKGRNQKTIQAYYLKEGDYEKRKYLNQGSNWEAKYLKYKEKYLALKNKLSK